MHELNEVGEEAANIVAIIKEMITTFKKILVFSIVFVEFYFFVTSFPYFLDTYAESDVINNYPGDEIPVKKAVSHIFF